MKNIDFQMRFKSAFCFFSVELLLNETMIRSNFKDMQKNLFSLLSKFALCKCANSLTTETKDTTNNDEKGSKMSKYNNISFCFSFWRVGPHLVSALHASAIAEKTISLPVRVLVISFIRYEMAIQRTSTKSLKCWRHMYIFVSF